MSHCNNGGACIVDDYGALCICECDPCLAVKLAHRCRFMDKPEPVPTSREEAFLAAVLERVKVARAKYPGNAHRLAAVMEEAGEVARSLNKSEGQDRLWEECLDLCATAVRLVIEGDASFAGGEKGTK